MPHSKDANTTYNSYEDLYVMYLRTNCTGGHEDRHGLKILQQMSRDFSEECICIHMPAFFPS